MFIWNSFQKKNQMIRNIKELKDAIKELPDDMEVCGYDGSDRECFIEYWIQKNDKEYLKWLSTQTQINNSASHMDRIIKPYFVLSTDN